jgi:RHS repeat-associated protein
MTTVQMQNKSKVKQLIGFLSLPALLVVSPLPAQVENDASKPKAELRLMAPDGREVFSPGETCLIKWRNQQGGKPVNHVRLEFSPDNGSTYFTIVDRYPNTGECRWIVPHHISAKCLVRISEANDPAGSKLSDFRLTYLIWLNVPGSGTIDTGTGNLFTVWLGDALNCGARPFIPAITVSRENDGFYYVRCGNREGKFSAFDRREISLKVDFYTALRSAYLRFDSKAVWHEISFDSNLSFMPAISIAAGSALPGGLHVRRVTSMISSIDDSDGWQNGLFHDYFGRHKYDKPSGHNGWKWGEIDAKTQKSLCKPKWVTNHGNVRIKSEGMKSIGLELVPKDGKEFIAVKHISLPRNGPFAVSFGNFESRPKTVMANKEANHEAPGSHYSPQPVPTANKSSNRSASTRKTGRSSTQSTNLKDTYYIWSHDGKLMAEYDHEGNATKYYLYMGNRLIAEYHPQTNKYYYHMTDQINSTRIITDENGDVVFSAAYGPYGDKQKTWVNTYEPKLQFSGKERETYSGLDYFGARYYDPNRYRFLSVDPIINRQAALFNPQLWNLYAYSRNNPITFFDPDGRDIFEKLKKIAGKVAPVGMIPNTMQMEGWAEQKASYDKKVQKAIDIAIVVGTAIVVIEMASDSEGNDKKDEKGKRESRRSKKEMATDIPSWAKGKKPKPGQSGNEFAEELMNEKYGPGEWSKKSKEYSQIRKYGDRHDK